MVTLITGGAGFLGQALIARLEGKIRVVCRDEGRLVDLKQKYPDIEIITGDIADLWTVEKAMENCNRVFHLAAYKHAVLAEEFPFQCISSNVIGSCNILQTSLKTKPELVFGMSTDKACPVNGVYGATKFLMERLFQEAERINTDTKYRTMRCGNILYSTGSVLGKWKTLIENNQEVILTDGDATRFFCTADDAVDIMFACLDKSKDATAYSVRMKATSMSNLLEAMIEKYGNGKRPPIKVIGLQPGESKHETMDGNIFSNAVERFTHEEIMQKI